MARRFLTAFLLFLALSRPVLGDPPCISSCETQDAISSQCDGTEVGSALDQCTCDTFESGTATPLLNCVKKCPTAEQEVFVGNLPASCRGTLFPGVSAASSSVGSAPSSTESKSFSTASSTPTTRSETSAVATATSSGSTPSSSASKNAAATFGFEAFKVGALTGGLAVILL